MAVYIVEQLKAKLFKKRVTWPAHWPISDELWSLHNISGATYLMTSHISSALWTLILHTILQLIILCWKLHNLAYIMSQCVWISISAKDMVIIAVIILPRASSAHWNSKADLSIISRTNFTTIPQYISSWNGWVVKPGLG